MTKQPKIVLIEGNFSAGKTTLAEHLFKKTSFVLSLDWNEDLDDEGLKRKSDEIAEALIKSE